MVTPDVSRGVTQEDRRREESGMTPGWQTSKGVAVSDFFGSERQAELPVGKTLEGRRSPETRTQPSGEAVDEAGDEKPRRGSSH